MLQYKNKAMILEINNIPKVSFNVYNHLHWTRKKAFKDNLRLLLMSVTRVQLQGSYNLDFKFYFKGRKLDTINVTHIVKIIEDYLFKQDNENRKICMEVFKSTENKCILTITKN